MMNKIIVTGCSYSQNSGVKKPYPDLLAELPDVVIKNLAWPGQSNDTIIRNVKEQIRNGVKNTLFICQLTHLHRISKFCNVNKKWLDFQPNVVNIQPTIKDEKIQFFVNFYYDKENTKPTNDEKLGCIGVYGATQKDDVNLDNHIKLELLDWYEKYLIYLYDEQHEFFELHHKVDELTQQVKNSDNQILYLYWPEDNYDISLFTKNNFLSINGDYSMLKWSIKNKLTQKKDSHLSIEGHYRLTKEILKHLDIKSNINPQIL